MAPLVVESWIWFGCVMIVAASRFISRYLTRRLRFQPDDWAMSVVLCFYTTFIVTINIVNNTSSNLFPPGFDIASLTDSEKQRRAYGSKLILVVEQCQCVTIWGAKACLLLLYLRITHLRWQHVAIQVLVGYVLVSFVVMEILYFGVWCRPFHEYWAVPTNSSQCDAATNHLITNATFNLSSDLIMLAIGLPIFLRMRLPWRKKIPLVGIFSLGVFVILAAILNKVYSFSEPFGSMWPYWYVRESSTALLVANLPFVWKFWRKVAGLASSVSGTKSRTRAGTNVSGLDEEGQWKEGGQPARMGLLQQWSRREGKDVEMAGELRRYGSDRTMTFEEFLHCGQDKFRSDRNRSPPPCPPLAPARLHDSPPREVWRRDSTGERMTGPSTLPPSMDGSSWSASSFL